MARAVDARRRGGRRDQEVSRSVGLELKLGRHQAKLNEPALTDYIELDVCADPVADHQSLEPTDVDDRAVVDGDDQVLRSQARSRRRRVHRDVDDLDPSELTEFPREPWR